MKKNIALLILLPAMMAWQCSSPAKDKLPQEFNHTRDLAQLGIDSVKIASVDSLLQSFVDSNKVNCVTAFVAQKGNVIYHNAFGWKDVENQVPATTADYYMLFSQTKAITTAAFMTLVEKGLVSVDDPVSKYFPGIPDQVVTAVNPDGTYETRPVATPMTFAHLMSHSSGLGAGLVADIRRIEAEKAAAEKAEAASAMQKEPVEKTAAAPKDGETGTAAPATETQPGPCGQHSYYVGENSFPTLEEAMLDLARYPLGFDPGTEWNYHVSTNMLGYMIELISGKSLREYVKETILDPLGMVNTDWYYTPDKQENFVKPYNLADGKLEPATMMNMFVQGTFCSDQTYCEGAIGLNGPIGDYARFCQMMLNKGTFNGRRILKAETIEAMTTINRLPEVNSGGEGFRFGLGFELYNELKKPVPEVSNSAYAWGGMLGTEYIIDPENDLIVLYYLNMWQRELTYPLFLSKAYGLVQVEP